uniref:Uncharacterized protein n=1 Tax=Moniliophthora roreri TaxID=221103 RepID=A0A0W0G0I2_MONRR
MQHDNNKMFWR